MDVVCYDYRGFGDSSGIPTEVGLYHDAYVVWEWMTKERHIHSNEIIIHGHSLGRSIAAQLENRLESINDEEQKRPLFVILESPFTKLINVVDGFLPCPGLPKLLAPLLAHEFPTIFHFQKISSTPILIAHGKKDRVISYQQSKVLHKSVVLLKNLELLLVDEANHVNLIESNEFRDKFIHYCSKFV